MDDQNPLYALLLRPLQSQVTTDGVHLPLIRESDHLLLKMGELALVTKDPDANESMIFREVADELWFHIDGVVEFKCKDLRNASPTFENSFITTLDEPTLILVPSGVAFGLRAIENPATLIRLSTYEVGSHEQDRVIPWEEFD